MAATRAKKEEQHTPFCERDCNVSHHDLIKGLFSFNNFSDGYSNPGNLHLFYESIQSFISQGWNKDSVVPDPSRDLQCPMVYLACAFGKHKALKLLLKMDFEASISIRQTGETGLHAAVRYVYQSGAWSVNNSKKGVSKVRPKTRTASFEKILESLCEKSPEIIGQKDINWDTPLHVGAQELADVKANELISTGRLLIALNNRKLHFEQCFRSMLLKVVQLEEQGVISTDTALKIICCKNRERKSILNILAEGSNDEDASLEFLKFVLEKLEKRLSSNNTDSWSGAQTTGNQGTMASNVMMSPSYSKQGASQVPIHYVYPHLNSARKEISGQVEGKHSYTTDPTYQQWMMSESKSEESSTIHVVFGREGGKVTQSQGFPMRSTPEFNGSSNPTVTKTPASQSKPLSKVLKPQRKSNRSKRKSTEHLPPDNTCSTSVHNQPTPFQSTNTSITEKPRFPERMVLSEYSKGNQSITSTNVSKPNVNQAVMANNFNSSKDNLRKEIRESYQAAFSLEKECFRLESERLECLHGIKERKEQIESLQKQIEELEQKAILLANSKAVVENDWKVFQQKEKELKKILLSPETDKNLDGLTSSKIPKLDQ